MSNEQINCAIDANVTEEFYILLKEANDENNTMDYTDGRAIPHTGAARQRPGL